MTRSARFAAAMACLLPGCSDPEADALPPGTRVVLVGPAGRPDTRAWPDERDSIVVPGGSRAVVVEDRPAREGIVPGT